MKLGASGGSWMVVVATVATALGVCAIAATVMSPLASSGVSGWVVAGAGVVALIAGLTVLVVTFGRRDRNLR